MHNNTYIVTVKNLILNIKIFPPTQPVQVPNKVVVTTGTQYDRQDVLQAQQLLAASKQHESHASHTPQRLPHTHPSVPTPGQTRSIASDGNKSSQNNSTRLSSSSEAQQRLANAAPQQRQIVAPKTSNASPRSASIPTRPANAQSSSASPADASGAKASSTPGNVNQSSQVGSWNFVLKPAAFYHMSCHVP